jgi:hypothetical protein
MAFRLIFEAEGDEVRLVRKQRVEMDAPEQPAASDARALGVFAELRNRDEETLYQLNLSPQLDHGVEVFAPDAAIRRVDAPAEKRFVVVVVPEQEDANAVVLVRRSGETPSNAVGIAGESAEGTRELARVSLEEEVVG